ncbi:MAG: putative 7-carboxy-7-deazaguanine synthase QueE [Lachnospiraceae bacterium]|nr:putative 7-carboxy-7-deazaguanine synthase QueE [Lachnospiraceae bacterium]
MQTYKVVEKFVSINGEGQNAGKIAAFIRFAGCNLNCSFCDTKWANCTDAPYEEESAAQIVEYIKTKNVRYVTLTGGEPLLREGIPELTRALLEIEGLTIEFETNGSVSLAEMDAVRRGRKAEDRVLFTMDYKLIVSGMEEHMKKDNFAYLLPKDTVKFVVGSKADLERMRKIIKAHALSNRCALYVSPVFGQIEAAEIVDYIIENQLNEVTMQLQMHKFIWDPDKRGV